MTLNHFKEILKHDIVTCKVSNILVNHIYYGFPLFVYVCVCIFMSNLMYRKKFPLLIHCLMHMPCKQLQNLPALLTGFLPLSPFDFTSSSPVCPGNKSFSLYSYLTLDHGITPPTFLQTHDEAFSAL